MAKFIILAIKIRPIEILDTLAKTNSKMQKHTVITYRIINEHPNYFEILSAKIFITKIRRTLNTTVIDIIKNYEDKY